MRFFVLLAVWPMMAAALNKPVTLVVPFSPESGEDKAAGVISRHLTNVLGQQVFIENRSGESGLVGARYAAQATGTNAVLLFANSAMTTLPINFINTFRTVGGIGSTQMVLVTNKRIESITDFVAKNPSGNMIPVATSGDSTASGICGGKILKKLDPKYNNHVLIAYRGEGPALKDLTEGRTDIACLSLPTLADHFSNVNIIGVAGPQRAKLLPNTPTLAEQGFADAMPRLEYGIHTSASAPNQWVLEISEALAKVLMDPKVVSELEKIGVSALQSAHPSRIRAYDSSLFTEMNRLSNLE